MMTITEEMLKEYRLSDHPQAWILEAEGFRHSAELLMLALQRKPRPKFISAQEANLNNQCLKNACFLFSISIELFLKAIYSSTKLPEDKESTESFRHNLHYLNGKLVAKNVLSKNELDRGTLDLAYVILSWFGRYYKPLDDHIESVVKEWFEKVPDKPGMVKPKFTVNMAAANNLQNMAILLSGKIPFKPGSFESIFFSPF